MKIKNIIKHVDKRGKILNLISSKYQSCAIIFSKKGTIRANHYHKKIGIIVTFFMEKLSIFIVN